MRNMNMVIGGMILSLIVLGSGVHAELYKRAPDVLPGTLPEMRDPVFWVMKMENPDEVVLTPEAIQDMNEAYQRKINSPELFKGVKKERIPNLSHWWPGFEMVIPDLSAMPPESVADTVRAKITVEIDYLRNNEFGNALAVEYSERERADFEREMALERVKNDRIPTSGIAVRNTYLRNVPSFNPLEVGLRENGKTRWDTFNTCPLKIGKAVTALHPSQTGEYVFIQCGEGYGWVRSEDIAFGNRQQIEAFVNPDNFVVCTGDRVMFYTDESCMYAAGWFGMGDRLPLMNNGNTRRIVIPAKRADGRFFTETAWLARDADVHIGWLPYTRRNIVVTAFKLLDNPYDWTAIRSYSVDVLISGQAFEHIEFFWVTILEIERVLKPGGLCCIIAPSGGVEHRFPVDCWRFYPDGFDALGRFAHLEVMEASTQWKPDPRYTDPSNTWQDSVLICRKKRRSLLSSWRRHIIRGMVHKMLIRELSHT